MALIMFHLFLSSFTFDGIDVLMAQQIIDWNLKRFPNGEFKECSLDRCIDDMFAFSEGVFFLLGAGQAALMRSQPRLAVGYYTKAIESQSQYRNLHHLSFWEIAISYLALWDIPNSLSNWKDLQAEASVRSLYFY
jgi:hypothetical protein